MRTLRPYRPDPVPVPVFFCEGDTHRIEDFVRRNSELLAPLEEAFLSSKLGELSGLDELPGHLSRPITRSPWLGKAPVDAQAVESGERSIFLPASKVKIKGCAPSGQDEDFPFLILRFGSAELEREAVPYGVLTAEAVLREIMGYCFMISCGFNPAAAPACVIEYRHDRETLGFALGLNVSSDHRVVSFLEYDGVLLRDLVARSMEPRDASRRVPWSSEVRLKGINSWRYLEQKSHQMSEMHFQGGFRGVLNSNLSNDVVIAGDDGLDHYSLCDFDSFHLVDIPDVPDEEFLRSFALAALAEVTMGSLPVMDFVELDSSLGFDGSVQALSRLYQQKSSSWRAYWRAAEEQCRSRGWDQEDLREAFARAFATPLFVELLRSCILSSINLPGMGSSSVQGALPGSCRS